MNHPTFVLVGVLLLVVLAFSGCSRDTGVTEDQAEEAFIVAFGGAYVGSMAAQFGQPVPGISLDEDAEAVVFDAFDVSELQSDYDTISGTVRTTDASAVVDLTLTGGPVTSIAFEVTADQMGSDDGIVATATVNGTEMEIRIDPESSLD